jgi:hypothetical protein
MKVFSTSLSSPYRYVDADCKWMERFNKETHQIQKGEFTQAVQGNPASPPPLQAMRTPGASAPTQQYSPPQHIYIPPGIDVSDTDREAQRRNLARIVLANPTLFEKLNPLRQAITICEASDLDETDQSACLQRAVLDDQQRHADDADFQRRFLNVPHPTVGETRKMVHACNVELWLDEHRTRRITLPKGTEVVITSVSGTGNSQGKVAKGEYAGNQVLFMDSDLAPKDDGQE